MKTIGIFTAALIVGLLVLIAPSNAQTTLLDEQWNSGSIDTGSTWDLDNSGGAYSVVEYDPTGHPGDMALQMSGDGSWTQGLFKQGSFDPTGNVQCTLKIWGGDPQGLSQDSTLAGPFHRTMNFGNSFWENLQIGVTERGNGGANRFGLNGWGQNFAGGALFSQVNLGSQTLAAAWNGAASREAALTMQFTLGTDNGCRFGVSEDDGANYFIAADSRDTGIGPSYPTEFWLGFASVTGIAHLDDILLQEGVTPPVTPTPGPTATITPTPAEGPLPYFEDWNAGVIDPARWQVDHGVGAGGNLAYEVVEYDPTGAPGDFAMLISEGGAQWTPGLVSNYFWDRSAKGATTNLRCTFTMWADTTQFPMNESGGGGWPNDSAIAGPWHGSQDLVGPAFWQNLVHGISERGPGANQKIGGPWGSGNLMSSFSVSGQGLDQRWDFAISRSFALTFEVTVDAGGGATFRSSRDDGNTFSSAGTSGTSTSDPLYLGFGGPSQYVFVDNIYVEDDNNNFGGAPPPTSTPGAGGPTNTPGPPTSTPNPVSGVDDWDSYE